MLEGILDDLATWNPRAARHLRENCRRRNAVSLSWEARHSMTTKEQLQHAKALIKLDEMLIEDWRGHWC